MRSPDELAATWLAQFRGYTGAVDRADLADLLRQRDAEHERVSGWVPVSERLPEQPDEYLVVYVDPDGGRPALVFSETFCDGDFLCDGITHWQPLPAPPSPAGEQATKEGEGDG